MADTKQRAWLAATLVLLVSCAGGSSGSPAGGTEPAPTSATAADGSQPDTTGSSVQPPADLSAHPLVWLGPLPPLPAGSTLPFNHGADDYMELFAPDAPWPNAAAKVDVFLIYSSWVNNYASDDDLRTLLAGLRDRGIALAVEVGALPTPAEGTCDAGEGYGAQDELNTLQHIARLGGRVDLVSFDEPFAFGHQNDAPNACRRPIEQVAGELAEFVAAARGIFPDLVAGGTEPMWQSPLIGPEDVGQWLDAYAAAAGEPMQFLHIDIDWTRPDWLSNAVAVEQVAADRGVPVGYIYNGGEADYDAEWVSLAAQRMALLEANSSVPPDEVVFQAWTDHPLHVLPETDPAAMTSLINRYFSPRTTLADVEAGPAAITGRVLSAGGPGAGLEVTATVVPLAGTPTTVTFSGTVPEGATEAVWVFRVNGEGTPSIADVDATVDSVSLRQAGDELVPNAEFSGSSDWSGYNAGAATIGGGMLRLRAASTELLMVDSTHFPVTPGAGFDASVTATVPAGAAGAVFAGVVFLVNGSEVHRDGVVLVSPSLALGPVVTAADGTFRLELPDPPSAYLADVSLDDPAAWPATAQVASA